MNELHVYIKKVMWYGYQEYDIPMVSVEEFEKSPIALNHVMNYFLGKQPFQNCATSLIEYLEKNQDMKA
jgi:hypothetical protein